MIAIVIILLVGLAVVVPKLPVGAAIFTSVVIVLFLGFIIWVARRGGFWGGWGGGSGRMGN